MDRPPRPEIMLEIRLPEIATDSDSRQAYDEIYTEGDISQRASFYLWLVEMFALRPGEVYLDISCGRVHLPKLARARGAVAHGLDLSHAALRIGRERTGVTNVVTANSQDLPYASDSFDVISNIGSMEHYVDMYAAVREMTRVLKPGGRAYVLVPNTFSLTTNIWNAMRQGRTSIDEQPIQRYAARLEWKALLEEYGLVVEKTYKYERERPRTRADLVYYLTHPKDLARVLFQPFVPLNLAFCFVFVARKPR
ncbi:MAG: class I SAM-dependent methyltransferase [Anaerolinea sp.]|nr:class I SAM-dependent methyltransferase [Anaerolinea sp.]